MSIIRNAEEVRAIYREAGRKKWVIPCLCTENLTTSEAILTAAEEFRREKGLETLPITVAITCRYDHRSQAVNYTHTRRWDIGLRLFTEEMKVLCEGENAPFRSLQVLLHLDHIRPESDGELLEQGLEDYASIMYDASSLPLEENIEMTAAFVAARRGDILIEGACDEIVDAAGSTHNDLTTPENAGRFLERTGVDLVVCNLGTEHRASGKSLRYHGEVSRAIRDVIGDRIVLHGTSSVPNDQIRGLFGDGVCKVNIWTALERDASPLLLEQMLKNPCKIAGSDRVRGWIGEGLLPPSADSGEAAQISHFTTLYRQSLVFDSMKKAVREYLDLWYT